MQGECNQNINNKIDGNELSIVNGEADMLNAVLVNPVATYIIIPLSMFLLNYKEGIYTDESCMNSDASTAQHGGTYIIFIRAVLIRAVEHLCDLRVAKKKSIRIFFERYDVK
jgi:hypothetical protein